MGRARKNLTFSILQIESYSIQSFVTQIVLPRFSCVVACAGFCLVVLFFPCSVVGIEPRACEYQCYTQSYTPAQYTLLDAQTFLFIHFPIDAHLCCAPLSVLVTTTLNMAVELSVAFNFGYATRGGIFGSYSHSVFNLLN